MENEYQIIHLKTQIHISKCSVISWFIALIFASFQKIVILPDVLQFVFVCMCIFGVVASLVSFILFKAMFKSKAKKLNYDEVQILASTDNNKMRIAIATIFMLLYAPAIVAFILYKFKGLTSF